LSPFAATAATAAAAAAAAAAAPALGLASVLPFAELPVALLVRAACAVTERTALLIAGADVVIGSAVTGDLADPWTGADGEEAVLAPDAMCGPAVDTGIDSAGRIAGRAPGRMCGRGAPCCDGPCCGGRASGRGRTTGRIPGRAGLAGPCPGRGRTAPAAAADGRNCNGCGLAPAVLAGTTDPGRAGDKPWPDTGRD
ncbi:hypothetical protein J3B02_005485, partial [Coemansia erecta]